MKEHEYELIDLGPMNCVDSQYDDFKCKNCGLIKSVGNRARVIWYLIGKRGEYDRWVSENYCEVDIKDCDKYLLRQILT